MKHEPLLGHAGLLQLASSPAPKFERFCRDQHSHSGQPMREAEISRARVLPTFPTVLIFLTARMR